MIVYRLAPILAVALVLTGAVRMHDTAPAKAQGAGCTVNPSELAIDAEEQSALEAINVLRAASGLATLSFTPTLGHAAAHKSERMATTGIFSHDDPGRSWLQRVAECGYRASQVVTENLALGTDSGRATVQMWRESPGHHRNMMNPAIRAVGIARVRSGTGTWYWTANFGGALDSGAAPAPAAVVEAPVAAAPTAPTAAVSATQLQVGGLATVNAGSGDCLNVRAGPGRGATINRCVADRTIVRVLAGPVAADGTNWWQLEGLGWASGEYLVSGAAGG